MRIYSRLEIKIKYNFAYLFFFTFEVSVCQHLEVRYTGNHTLEPNQLAVLGPYNYVGTSKNSSWVAGVPVARGGTWKPVYMRARQSSKDVALIHYYEIEGWKGSLLVIFENRNQQDKIRVLTTLFSSTNITIQLPIFFLLGFTYG